MGYPPPLKVVERLKKTTGTFLMRNVRELCRAYLADSMANDESGKCPICERQAKDAEDIITNHWRCVLHEFLYADPNYPGNELLDEDHPDFGRPGFGE